MDPATLKKLNILRKSGKNCVLITDLTDGRDRAVAEGDLVAGVLGDAINTAFKTNQAARIEIGGRAFFINPFSA